MGEEVSITVLACNGVDNGVEEYRAPNFYKKRREMMRSPLGPDATVEKTWTTITSGFQEARTRVGTRAGEEVVSAAEGGILLKALRLSPVDQGIQGPCTGGGDGIARHGLSHDPTLAPKSMYRVSGLLFPWATQQIDIGESS
ncbi:hypothetical protein ACHAWF_001739 [Thalassiosira exigua]